MDSLSIKFERKKLYDEIWDISLTGVSKKYGLNYTKLVQACKENNIPYPSSAYWTKKNMGLDFSTEIVELPEAEEKEIEIPLKNTGVLIDEKVRDKDKFIQEFNFLNFLEEDEKKKVAKVIYDLSVDKYKRNHKVIIEYKNKKKEERREERKANYFNPYYNIHNYVEKGYFSNVSKMQKDRCMKILSTIYFAIEELGGKVNNDFSLQVREEHVTIEIEELQDKVMHELTKEEAKKLLEYEESQKRHTFGYKPNIRKYDYVYNGKFKIAFGNRKYIRESDKVKLEDKLGDIIIKLYEQSEETKNERLEREEIERREREEEERKEKIRNAKKNEAQKIKKLMNCAEDYKIACEIRNYIDAVSKKENLTDEIKEWIKWANKKANWLDPTIDEEDELLGKRDHTESMNNKNNKLDKYGSYYDWD
ncbi:MAG: hypothetical protein HFJ26_07545 [Clostridia bacterium]|nr:hypothetical protein [Clostridia bacterium]